MTTEAHSGRHLVAQENKANLTVGRVASVLSDTHTEQSPVFAVARHHHLTTSEHQRKPH